MLTVKFSPDANRSKLNQVKAGIQSTKPQILNECGSKLVGLARIYFDNLSKGGAGFSGRRWPAPTAGTLKKRESLLRRGKLQGPVNVQGVQSGRMRASLRYTVNGNSVSVSYKDPAARWFNIHRRLIPSVLPTVWRNQLDAIVYNDLKDI
jgi:hypothetical protein